MLDQIYEVDIWWWSAIIMDIDQALAFQNNIYMHYH